MSCDKCCIFDSITDVEEAATLSIISALLTDGELSPCYQSLLEANIGSDYAPVVGYGFKLVLVICL